MQRAISIPALTMAAVALAALPAAAGGGGGGGGGGPCRGFGSGDTILMRDNCFEGVGHVVEAGSTIRVQNAGRQAHTFTAVDGSFDSGVMAAGETWQLTVTDPGPVEVYCTLHSTTRGDGMAGLLTVIGVTATADAAATGSDAPDTDATATTGPADRGLDTPLWLLGGGLVAAAGIVHGRRASREVGDQPRLPSAGSVSSSSP